MRLIRLLITLAVLGGVVYLGVSIPLGGKTLWGHIRAIAGSRESQELVEGVKQKAKEVVAGDAGTAGKSQDRLTSQERKLLRKLIREKLGEGKQQGEEKQGEQQGKEQQGERQAARTVER